MHLASLPVPWIEAWGICKQNSEDYREQDEEAQKELVRRARDAQTRLVRAHGPSRRPSAFVFHAASLPLQRDTLQSALCYRPTWGNGGNRYTRPNCHERLATENRIGPRMRCGSLRPNPS